MPNCGARARSLSLSLCIALLYLPSIAHSGHARLGAGQSQVRNSKQNYRAAAARGRVQLTSIQWRHTVVGTVVCCPRLVVPSGPLRSRGYSAN
uniref:Putative secreted protein n=1 Tax=Anopheles darlingi TaxID=43151 RepID=A0A2M4DQT9_ANODA